MNVPIFCRGDPYVVARKNARPSPYATASKCTVLPISLPLYGKGDRSSLCVVRWMSRKNAHPSPYKMAIYLTTGAASYSPTVDILTYTFQLTL